MVASTRDAMTDPARIDSVLHYWFGELDADGMTAEAQQKLWFQPPPGTDETIRDDFDADVAEALAGRRDDWAASPRGLVALTLLLDQFPRNIHRGTPAAFSGDDRALALVREAVATGADEQAPTIHRVFLYIPFEHAEDLAAQDEGIAHFDRLISQSPASTRERLQGFRGYAVAHREVIAKLGRFPHRNEILGRTTTDEERAWLAKHGGF